MYYTYLLYSPDYDKFYVGYTGHLPLRFIQHNCLSIKSFTSKYRPWKLALVIPCQQKSLAIKLERLLKKQKSKKFFKRWILQRQQEIVPVKINTPS